MKSIYLKTYKIKELERRENDNPINSIRSQGVYEDEELLSEVRKIITIIFPVPKKRDLVLYPDDFFYDWQLAINKFGYRYTHGLLLPYADTKVLDSRYHKADFINSFNKFEYNNRKNLSSKEKRELLSKIDDAKDLFYIKHYKKEQDRFLEKMLRRYLEPKLISTLIVLGIDIDRFWYVLLLLKDYIDHIPSKPIEYHESARNSFTKFIDLLETVDEDNFNNLEPKITLKVKGAKEVKIECFDTLLLLKEQMKRMLVEKSSNELDIKYPKMSRKMTFEDAFSIDGGNCYKYTEQPQSYKIYFFSKYLKEYLKRYKPIEGKKPSIESVILDYIDKNDGEKAVSTDKNILVSNLLYVVGYIDKDEWEKAKKDNKFINSKLKGINKGKLRSCSLEY